MHRPSTFLATAILFLSLTASAPFQRPDAPQFAVRGPFPVGTQELTTRDAERPLDITIWYPASSSTDQDTTVTYADGILQVEGRATRDAEPARASGPYPLVIFSHGSGGFRWQSLWLTEHLASYGFVVMAADHAGNTIFDGLAGEEVFAEAIPRHYVLRPQDVLQQIALAESLADDPSLGGVIDTETIAVMGHSFGGYTALAAAGVPVNFGDLESYCSSPTTPPNLAQNVCFLLEERDEITSVHAEAADQNTLMPVIADPRVDAVVAMAPWNRPILDSATLADLNTPTMILVGTSDNTTPAQRDAFRIAADMDSAPVTLVAFDNADHYVFVDSCTDLAIRFGFFSSCSDPVWDMARAHDISAHLITAFLLETLLQDDQASEALSPEVVEFPGVAYSRSTDSVVRLIPQVIASYPHDDQAWTQGLLLSEGRFFESTGLRGQSSLREVDVTTGTVLRQRDIPDPYFAEGLALVDGRLIQITWQENTAFVYDAATFEQIDSYTYAGEGWGLCYDGTWLYMSDGSATVTLRDPDTFTTIAQIEVTNEGNPVTQLNELECVEEFIYANVWLTDEIVRFDKATGQVDAIIDASGLLTDEQAQAANVLNGIAYDETQDRFYITGKNWPTMFLVSFVPDQG